MSLKIAFGDLRHHTVGLHSIYIPIGIGYIGSYAETELADLNPEVRLFTEPTEMISAIEDWTPDIVGVSNYLWNSNISYRICEIAKELNPATLTIAGGPNFSHDNEERKTFLLQRPCFDFYVLADGEQAFCALIRNWVNEEFDLDQVRAKQNDGIASLSLDGQELIVGCPIKRFINMDTIPSPYLNGMFDKYLKSDYMPALNTTRGCPYTCTFCHTGNPHKVRSHTVDRVKEELDYIANNITDPTNKDLCIFDDNFGLFKEDDEIAEYISILRKKTNWPNRVEGPGAVKKGGKTFIPDYEILKTHNIGWSFQSVNPETLRVIKRQNPTIENVLEVSKEILKRQNVIPCELIAPMPLETIDSYFSGQKYLMDKGFSTSTYTTMLLPGTEMAKPESRRQYGLETKYRLIPRQFGEYKGRKIFEIEEVCVATNTFSYLDYLDMRDFSLIVRIFSNEQFSLVARYLEEIGLSRFDFVYKAHLLVREETTTLSPIVESFRKEAKTELFSTPKELIEEYSSKDVYEELLKSDRADNLLRKYTAKAFFLPWKDLLDIAHRALNELDQSHNRNNEAFETIYKITLGTRDINAIINRPMEHSIVQYEVPYDVCAWAEDKYRKSLLDYKKRTIYQIKWTDQTRKALDTFSAYKTIRGGDDEFALGNMIARGFKLSDLWLSAERLN